MDKSAIISVTEKVQELHKFCEENIYSMSNNELQKELELKILEITKYAEKNDVPFSLTADSIIKTVRDNDVDDDWEESSEDYYEDSDHLDDDD